MSRFGLLLTVTCCCWMLPHATGDDATSGAQQDPIRKIDLLPPGPNNPRNSEGDFIRLDDGRIMLVYTHFTGGAADDASAHLAARFSSDEGLSWTGNDMLVIPNEGDQNVMSVSLLRLASGEIALFYLRKNSWSDCRPVMRTSSDEARTWSDPIEIIPEHEQGYYVLNNDRVIQLSGGRLVAPLAQHAKGSQSFTANATLLCYYSDDHGRSWVRGDSAPTAKTVNGQAVVLQEPGVIALRDDRLMMWCRTSAGSQYVCHSDDRGHSWTVPRPSAMVSPLSPATIERIPATGHLLLVWNDHRGIDPALRGKRTPLTAAISSDEGETWDMARNLEDDPHGWYCYTAMMFVDDHVLLAYCAGDRRQNNGLAFTRVTRVPVEWIYKTPSPESLVD